MLAARIEFMDFGGVTEYKNYSAARICKFFLSGTRHKVAMPFDHFIHREKVHWFHAPSFIFHCKLLHDDLGERPSVPLSVLFKSEKIRGSFSVICHVQVPLCFHRLSHDMMRHQSSSSPTRCWCRYKPSLNRADL